MTTAIASRASQPKVAVEAELNYLRDTGQRPVSYTFEPPPGVPRYSGVREPQRVVIRNGRLPQYAAGFSLDTTGFELHRHVSRVRNFADHDAIHYIYYREAEQLIKQVTGASKVVVFDHTLRDGTPEHGRAGIREPVHAVHNDQTFISGPRRVRDHLPADEAEQRLQKRFAILNFWRPIGHTVEQTPLAVCDARTIAFGDLVPSDLVYPDKVGETYAVKYNPQHLWFYFPNMAPSEVLLLKIFDSRVNGTARATAHTAFNDPSSPPNAVPRRSIELRTLVFWDK